jgi:hypothetical protein
VDYSLTAFAFADGVSRRLFMMLPPAATRSKLGRSEMNRAIPKAAILF